MTKGTAPSFSSTVLASNRLSGYSYDAAGNMLGDGQHTYVYNAESQISSLDSGATAYVYDAAGCPTLSRSERVGGCPENGTECGIVGARGERK